VDFIRKKLENSWFSPNFALCFSMQSDKLVIIPTYNEVENIADMIHAIMDLEEVFDVLVIDDQSPDGTAEVVKTKKELFPGRIHLLQREGKQGLGTAYIDGFQYALARNYAYIFEMDADFSHNPLDLPKLYRACAVDGFDMAIGSRYITGVNVVNWPMGRVLMSFFASIYVQFITGIPIKDTTAGFVCYKARVLRAFPLEKVKFIGYAFQIEMKFTTWKMGFKIVEVPIIFTDRTKGTSKMSKHIFREAIFGVIYMKVKSWFKKYPANQNG
jgi:dolichol-phosphate mannosyltransferase